MEGRRGKHTASARPNTVAALILASLALALGGCALPALIHDEILGPVSPAGEVHAATVGANFHVTDKGVAADDAGEAVFRPYSPDFLRRTGRPENLYFIAKGIEAAISGISPIEMRDRDVGRPLAPERLAGLRPGLTAAQVLERLGAPQQWVRRREGSIMAYRAEVSRSLSIYVGIPPGLGQFLPVPGLNTLHFRHETNERKPYKTILFFDPEDVLRAAFSSPGGKLEDGSGL